MIMCSLCGFGVGGGFIGSCELKDVVLSLEKLTTLSIFSIRIFCPGSSEFSPISLNKISVFAAEAWLLMDGVIVCSEELSSITFGSGSRGWSVLPFPSDSLYESIDSVSVYSIGSFSIRGFLWILRRRGCIHDLMISS